MPKMTYAEMVKLERQDAVARYQEAYKKARELVEKAVGWCRAESKNDPFHEIALLIFNASEKPSMAKRCGDVQEEVEEEENIEPMPHLPHSKVRVGSKLRIGGRVYTIKGHTISKTNDNGRELQALSLELLASSSASNEKQPAPEASKNELEEGVPKEIKAGGKIFRLQTVDIDRSPGRSTIQASYVNLAIERA